MEQKEDIKRLDILLNEIQDKKNFINILQLSHLPNKGMEFMYL